MCSGVEEKPQLTKAPAALWKTETVLQALTVIKT